MPSDGDEYESEYDEEEESIGARGDDRVGDNTATKADTEAEAQASGGDFERDEAIAEIDVHHPELEVETAADDHQIDGGAAGEALQGDQDLLTIDRDPRDEDVAQQFARNAQSDVEPVSNSIQASKAPTRRLAADVARCQRLERLLNQSKKANAELRNQLQQLYRNDAIAQLENRAKEKQARIDELTQENRLLKHQQRQLSKEIEDFHESKGNFPTERRALLEQLRMNKEKLRQLKDARQTSDDKLARLHQQVVDLTTKNKALVEQVRQLEDASASSPAPTISSSRLTSHSQDMDAIIASQEEEITRLQQRVALMKKSHKAERGKFEKMLKASQEEVEQTRQQLDAFEYQVGQRDKAARAQFLSLKTLKRAVHELALAHQSNRHLEQLLTEREVRYANGRSPRTHGQRHHSQQPHPTGRPLGDDNSFNHSSSAFHRQNERIYDTLLHLGYVPPLGSPGQDHQATGRSKSVVLSSNGELSSIRDAEEPKHHASHADIEFVQGKLMPRPPSSLSSDAKTGHPPVGLRSNSARAQFYSARSSLSARLTERRRGTTSKVEGVIRENSQAITGRDEELSGSLPWSDVGRQAAGADLGIDTDVSPTEFALEPSPGDE